MKVTFIDGVFQGKVLDSAGDAKARERMFEACPDLCPFLQRIGGEGWELVAAYALPFPDGVMEKLIFKRPR
jgi:hypothetical protein